MEVCELTKDGQGNRTNSYAEEIQKLLSENQLLHEKYDQLCESSHSQIEELQQKNYVLSQSLSSKCKMEQELELQCEQIQEEAAKKISENRQSYSSKISTLESKIKDLEKELEEMQRSEQDLVSRCNAQLTELESLKRQRQKELSEHLEQLKQHSYSADSDDQLTKLANDNASLTSELEQSTAKVVQLNFALETQQREHQLIAERCEEAELVACDYSRQIKVLNEQIAELCVEVDSLRFQINKPSGKGNSLFAEVDRQRILLESEVLKLRGQVQRLKDHQQQQRAEIQRLQHSVRTAWLLGGSANCDSATKEEISNLKASLITAQTEARTTLCENLILRKSLEKLDAFIAAANAPGVAVYKTLLAQLRAQYDALVKSLESERQTRFIAEDARLEVQTKLSNTERKVGELGIVKMKLLLQVEELKEQQKAACTGLDNIKARTESQASTSRYHQVQPTIIVTDTDNDEKENFCISEPLISPVSVSCSDISPASLLHGPTKHNGSCGFVLSSTPKDKRERVQEHLQHKISEVGPKFVENVRVYSKNGTFSNEALKHSNNENDNDEQKDQKVEAPKKQSLKLPKGRRVIVDVIRINSASSDEANE